LDEPEPRTASAAPVGLLKRGERRPLAGQFRRLAETCKPRLDLPCTTKRLYARWARCGRSDIRTTKSESRKQLRRLERPKFRPATRSGVAGLPQPAGCSGSPLGHELDWEGRPPRGPAQATWARGTPADWGAPVAGRSVSAARWNQVESPAPARSPEVPIRSSAFPTPGSVLHAADPWPRRSPRRGQREAGLAAYAAP